jgi:4-alpha-glucanotransferase
MAPVTQGRVRGLQELTRLYGVQTAYYDITHQRRRAAPEVLLRVLQALGAPLDRLSDVPAALRARRAEPWLRGVEPVTLVWQRQRPQLEVCRAARHADTPIVAELTLEAGEQRAWRWDAAVCRVLGKADVDGQTYVAQRCPLPGDLPVGYHRLALESAGQFLETTVICAPRRAYGPRGTVNERTWGVFLPVYAMRSARNWGCGDLSDLETLTRWVAGLGGGLVATLPLLAAFLGEDPFEPSPYAPASRLFWNELFVDLERAPELRDCPEAQALLDAPEVQARRAQLQDAPEVDYQATAALRRPMLDALAAQFFAGGGAARPEYQAFLARQPQVEDYARFRAATERSGAAWPNWPRRQQDGALTETDYDPAAVRHHLYAQWLAERQLAGLAERARADGGRLYLDLPLGVHADSYDVWRERGAFALGIAGGAPPDPFFMGGQNWGFPPLHPEAMRQGGYRYFRVCVQHHLAHAGVMRIDHVMGLHRLYWIPRGVDAREGVYVRYHADELYAVLSIESHRARAMLVGEDLGTVPRTVRAAMAGHGLQRMYVGQFELRPHAEEPLGDMVPRAAASLNTHDMYPFAAFWSGLDVPDRQRLGVLEDQLAEGEQRHRDAVRGALLEHLRRTGEVGASKDGEAETRAVLAALLRRLAASDAGVVLVNLEDLWLETEPQNVPGTWRERPNWRRKMRLGLDQALELPLVLDALQEVNRLRRRELT